MGWQTVVQCHAYGMNRILLIGSAEGKRRLFFEQAAREAGIPTDFLDWKEIWHLGEPAEPGIGAEKELCSILQRYSRDRKRLPQAVKIDAPQWDSSRLRDLEGLTDRYVELLRMFSRISPGAFLNHPLEIAEVLDKRRCKKRLLENNISATRMYGERFCCGEELLAFMEERRITQVFVKPVKGAGAAGVAALRFSPKTGRIALYTCAALEAGELFNTKRMYRLEGKTGTVFLDSLLKLDCVVERWYGKASFQGCCYDLRVIVQEGRIDYILPRLSKGPITNLHLNNRSVEFRDLHLDTVTTERISRICLEAAACYPGLRSIGMDVLLERGSLMPRIIELNAQGDLLHRDIYGENRIYRRQIEIMADWL